MVINPIVGVYIPIIRIPIKGGMTIPNIATFDHGTNRKKSTTFSKGSNLGRSVAVDARDYQSCFLIFLRVEPGRYSMIFGGSRDYKRLVNIFWDLF